MGGIEAALAEHAFEHLFIECLGWDRLGSIVTVGDNGARMELTGVAQKRGFAVFVSPSHRTVLANRGLLRDVQRQIRRSHHEHILIHVCETPRKQVWQWATATADGRRILHREHPFFSNKPPPRLLERIEGMSISFAEEEQTGLTDVLARVRTALAPDSELNLFAKHPSYAAESDRRAMAVKRSEPGALGAFVEFHIPLARKASRMLIRWFEMDPDDAEQTAMIGLIEAARRFDPERGFQFSTYASYWIRQCCQRYGLEWGLPIRMPTHLFWPCYKMLFVEAKLLATYGDHEAQPRFEQELKNAGVTREQWALFSRARQVDCFSEMDKALRPTLSVSEDSVAATESACSAELRKDIEGALELLKPRQARILALRYGLAGREHTLQEVADILGITRERVRQIQAKAEEKLEQLLRRTGYRDEATVVPIDKNSDHQESIDL
jgi:RNA polymerase sigma factor (sigma-70 family)